MPPFLRTLTEIVYKPKWKRDALLLDKAAKRFVNYKRDLLAAGRAEEVESRRHDLKMAIKQHNKRRVREASKQLQTTCDNALPNVRPTSPLGENIEVFFVAIAIAIGIRAYITQPFRIPTGSMQPSLNGITGEALDKKDWPPIGVRATEIISKGRTYFHEELSESKTLLPDAERAITEEQRFNFFTYTVFHFTDGTTHSVNAPKNLLLSPISQDGFGLSERLGIFRDGDKLKFARTPKLPKGFVLASGYSQSGDLILVDKVSYHFRRPDRGETFVFDTRGIRGVHQGRGPQGGGSHYIKRLAGVPGDNLSIGGANGRDGRLYIDGQVASEKTLRNIMTQEGKYAENPGYILARGSEGYPNPLMTRSSFVLSLKDKKAKPLMREYAALGDNTDNSLDSRYWGTVKEFNLVGPALFSLWPFASGHWGLID